MSTALALTDRVAVVTGGGGGIGRATALELALLGARVVVADLDESSARRSAQAVVERGGQATACRVDVTSPDEHAKLMAHALEVFGRVDVMVNNAGIAQGGALLDWTPEMVERVTAVNQHGVLYGIQAAARVMRDAGRGGVIVNVGSIYGELATLYCIGYQATKAAVAIMTKVAAHELAAHRIRVVNVAPGVVDTNMIEDYRRSGLADRMAKKHMSGALVQPEQVARVIALLATDAASAINGTTVFADDGFSAFK
jgi:NAD(P)-dependent dehydrogenase (short-subunit alcohol dehydrogenase family)